MASYWKEPKEKRWFSVFADGHYVGTVEESPAALNYLDRIRGLVGIEIKKSTNEHLIKCHARTVLPSRIVKKMRKLAGSLTVHG
jgi:hypothetical protein